jgi:GT2 family glycosyltransferase
VKVFAIVLCFNGIDLTRQCLRSLEMQSYRDLSLIAVDNGSVDSTVSVLRSEFPNVQLIIAQDNLGYVGGNNLGIQAALDQGADCVFLVNNDTILDVDCVSQLVQAFAQDPTIGVVGPMVYTWDNWSTISSAGGEVIWEIADSQNVGAGEIDTGQYPSRIVDYVNGCGIMVRRGAIEAAGLLDPKFFMYWEETDWCLRISKAGFAVYFNRAARMQHKAAIVPEELGPTTLYYTFRNRVLFFYRHADRWMKLRSLAHAFHGGLQSLRELSKSGRRKHALAIRFALQHASIGKWGKADPKLWQ